MVDGDAARHADEELRDGAVVDREDRCAARREDVESLVPPSAAAALREIVLQGSGREAEDRHREAARAEHSPHLDPPLMHRGTGSARVGRRGGNAGDARGFGRVKPISRAPCLRRQRRSEPADEEHGEDGAERDRGRERAVRAAHAHHLAREPRVST